MPFWNHAGSSVTAFQPEGSRVALLLRTACLEMLQSSGHGCAGWLKYTRQVDHRFTHCCAGDVSLRPPQKLRSVRVISQGRLEEKAVVGGRGRALLDSLEGLALEMSLHMCRW
jgi:hypothetical protein